MIDYPMISKYYRLNESCILGVDQTNSEGDRTCLCFARLEEDKINFLDFKYIEKQSDIDKYINTNMKEIYGVFGLSLDKLRGEN